MIFAVDDLVNYFIKGNKDPELFQRLKSIVEDLQKEAQKEIENERDSFDRACDEWNRENELFHRAMKNMSTDEKADYDTSLSETAPIESNYKVYAFCELKIAHHTTEREKMESYLREQSGA